jgi:uncharacterized protein with HEPN domain
MSPRDWRLRIEDMLQAIGQIAQYVEGMTWEVFSTEY